MNQKVTTIHKVSLEIVRKLKKWREMPENSVSKKPFFIQINPKVDSASTINDRINTKSARCSSSGKSTLCLE